METVCHYFDQNQALRSGLYIRQIRKGKHKGEHLIKTSEGKTIRAKKIRNIETGGKDHERPNDNR